MTGIHAGEALRSKLEGIATEIGPYPHSKLTFAKRENTQGPRMMKVACPDPACGYQVRTTRKWINMGTPTCMCRAQMEEAT